MKISVVVPNYNNEQFLERCLDSLLNQTVTPFEIIVVDDCSSDCSVKIIKEYVQKSNIIKSFRNDKNIGVSKTRDLGIRASKADYFTTLDSDDFYFPDKIENELKMLERDENSIVFSDIALSDLEGKIIGKIETSPYSDTSVKRRLMYLISRKKGIPRDMLVPKRLYEEVGGFDLALNQYEDWDLKIRLSQFEDYTWKSTGKLGISYTQNPKGLSKANRIKHLKNMGYVLKKNFKSAKWKFSFLSGLFNLFVVKSLVKIFKISQ